MNEEKPPVMVGLDPIILSMEKTDKLAEALSKAQADFIAPLKKCKVDFTNNKGQRVKYNYADLADVLNSVKGPLSKNGLAVSHLIGYQHDMYGMETVLMHSSGQKISCWYPLPDPMSGEIRAQEFGSALTYARRYSLSALVGIASDEDEDGSSAPPTKPPPQQQRKPAPPPQQKPIVNHADLADEEMLSTLDLLMSERKVSMDEMNYLIINGFQLSKDAKLPKAVAQQIIDLLADDGATAGTVLARAEQMKNERQAKALVKPPADPKGDPGDFMITFGEKYNGKMLREVGETALRAMYSFIADELKKTPPPSDVAKKIEFQGKCKAFFSSMGLKL